MREYLGLGPTPADETCIQVGDPRYHSLARKESRIFISQLQRAFPDTEEKGCSFGIKSFPHDLGTYHDVVVYYDPEDPDATDCALNIEKQTPLQWDTEARAEHDTLLRSADAPSEEKECVD